MSCPVSTEAPAIHRLVAESAGAHAMAALRVGHRGRVTATFERSLYVELAGQWICLAARQTGRGPITLVCAAAGDPWPAGSFAVGMPVRIDRAGLRLGASIQVSLETADPWRPPAPGPWSAASLARGLSALAEQVSPMVAREGLGWFLLTDAADGRAPHETQAAAPAIAVVAAWLRHPDALPPGDALRALVGLGPGLTPSGDDFLGGMMIALHVLGDGERAARIEQAIRPTLAAATNPVSRALLSAAAEGMGGESLHAALNTVLTGGDEDLPDHLAAIDRIGHSSGWDALAGAIMVLRDWVARN